MALTELKPSSRLSSSSMFAAQQPRTRARLHARARCVGHAQDWVRRGVGGTGPRVAQGLGEGGTTSGGGGADLLFGTQLAA